MVTWVLTVPFAPEKVAEVLLTIDLLAVSIVHVVSKTIGSSQLNKNDLEEN